MLVRQYVVALLLVTVGSLAGAPSTAADTDGGTLVSHLPSRTVAPGTRVPVTGTATPTGRQVLLQARTANGWVTLGTTKAAADGGFTFAAPTWWVARQVLRVYAPATTDAEALASTTGTLKVTRGYTPRPGTTYRHLGGVKARWDACQVISYRVNPARMPAGALRDVHEAFRRISAATGLRFSYAGATAYVPYRKGSNAGPANTDMAIAWATPRQVPGLAGRVLGLGGYAAVGETGSWNRITQGVAVLDSTRRLAAGFASHRSTTRGLLLLHELGHALGLDHVDDRRQVMYPVLLPRAARYAGGDLRGLAAVGAARGCFSTSSSERRVNRTAAPPTYLSAP